MLGDVPGAINGCTNFPNVFPACAGMFLDTFTRPPGRLSFPRVRGDVPIAAKQSLSKRKFSPRARGCSAFAVRQRHPLPVFPACAGMFR